MSSLDTYLAAHAARFEDELCSFLEIASVSADSAYRPEIARAADWVAAQLKQLGFTAEILPTAGHPLIYAESPHVAGAPTVLVYGHYDVQPVVPLELWETPPFAPSRRNGYVYARGATDDKGQVFTHIKSAEAWIKTAGRLPVNLKFLIEGEEEIGSVNLHAFVKEQAERLACDCVVVSDSAQFGPGVPAITYGLRGIAYYEVHFYGPQCDLHSGSFGGGVTNPANALTKVLGQLVDARGRVQIPGFYDDVVPLTERERRQFAELPFDERRYFEQVGASAAEGEEGYSILERRWARPSCDINGLFGGYQGEGAKTVLPAEAGAKFSFRLVPNQDPERITEMLQAWLTTNLPPGIRMQLISEHGSPGVLVPLESRYMEAAARAIAQAFGRPPVYVREGGSIPVVATFHDVLKADTLLLGWGQEDDRAHSPNERFSLADFHRAIRASALLWDELAKC